MSRVLARHGKRWRLRERRGRIEFRDDALAVAEHLAVWCPYTDQRLGRRDWDLAGRTRCVENPAAMRAIVEFETDSVEEEAA